VGKEFTPLEEMNRGISFLVRAISCLGDGRRLESANWTSLLNGRTLENVKQLVKELELLNQQYAADLGAIELAVGECPSVTRDRYADA